MEREILREELKRYDLTRKPLPLDVSLWTKEMILEQTEWYRKRDLMAKELDLHRLI